MTGMFYQVQFQSFGFFSLLISFIFLGAHCFKNKGQNKMIERNLITAMLGKNDLNDVNEEGSVKASVNSILLHPDWNSDSIRYDADLAVVVLEEKVKFSDSIQAVCLPRFSESEVRGVGTVVGWGKSERSEAASAQHDTTPNQLRVPAINSSHCFTTFPILGEIASNRVFCGGYKDRSKAPCWGDSGSGYFLQDSSTSEWNVQGIISSAIFNPMRGCDIEKFQLYTNVGWFVYWIERQVRDTSEIDYNEIEFDCKERDK